MSILSATKADFIAATHRLRTWWDKFGVYRLRRLFTVLLSEAIAPNICLPALVLPLSVIVPTLGLAMTSLDFYLSEQGLE